MNNRKFSCGCFYKRSITVFTIVALYTFLNNPEPNLIFEFYVCPVVVCLRGTYLVCNIFNNALLYKILENPVLNYRDRKESIFFSALFF
jgi:hypothetical protein